MGSNQDGVSGSWFKPGLDLAVANGSPLSPSEALPLRKVKLGPTLRCNGQSHCLQCHHPIPALAADALGKAEDGPGMWEARMKLPVPAWPSPGHVGSEPVGRKPHPLQLPSVSYIFSSSHSRAQHPSQGQVLQQAKTPQGFEPRPGNQECQPPASFAFFFKAR